MYERTTEVATGPIVTEEVYAIEASAVVTVRFVDDFGSSHEKEPNNGPDLREKHITGLVPMVEQAWEMSRSSWMSHRRRAGLSRFEASTGDARVEAAAAHVFAGGLNGEAYAVLRTRFPDEGWMSSWPLRYIPQE